MNLFGEDLEKYKKIANSKFLPIDGITFIDSFTSTTDINKFCIFITTINQCNLNCFFCRGGISKDILHEQTKIKIMDNITFEKIVNKCIESGVRSFDLTPAIGELFLDKNLLSKLDFLENNKEVNNFFITTNLLSVKEADLLHLTKYRKMTFIISVYGFERDEYKKNTGKDEYFKFIENIELLYKISRDIKFNSVFFQIRTQQQSKNTLLYAGLVKMCYEFGYKLELHEKANKNRAGHVKLNDEVISRSGICPLGPGSGGGIDQNGNLLYCPFNDISKEGVVGNIFTTPLKDIYNSEKWKEIIEAHSNNNYNIGICHRCNETW